MRSGHNFMKRLSHRMDMYLTNSESFVKFNSSMVHLDITIIVNLNKFVGEVCSLVKYDAILNSILNSGP